MESHTSEPDPNTPAETWWARHARRVWLWVRVFGVVVVTAFAVWWFALAPVPVSQHTVGRGPVIAEVFGTGTLEARVSATVGPKLSGLIVVITADEGDLVRAGDMLIHLEDFDSKQLVAVAEAELAAAAAGMERLRADRLRAEAVLSQARRSHDRVLSAAESGAASVEEVDKAGEALAIAEAEFDRASASIVEGEMLQATSERNLDYQRARLDDTTIKAPFNGLVVRRDREPGDVVTAGSSVLQLVSLDELWISAWVDETELALLAGGQVARVVFRSVPTAEYPGEVSRVGRETDRETREVLVDVRVRELPTNWAVGQRAEVFIRVDGRDDATTLPSSLVLVRDGQTGVMVNDGGIAHWREITVGLRGRETVEVASGLSPGEVVVSPAFATSGPLRDGRRISPK